MGIPSIVVAGALLATPLPAAAQEFFRLENQQIRAVDRNGWCSPHSLQIPSRDDPWRVRASVVFDPADFSVGMSLYDVEGRYYGAVSNSGGYLEVAAHLPASTVPRSLAVCVGRRDESTVPIRYSVHGNWAGAHDPSC